MMKRFALLACVLALAACNQTSAPAEDMVDPDTRAGQEALAELVDSYLDDAVTQLAPLGQPAVGLNDQMALIAVNESPNNWNVPLMAGTNYVFVGRCDNECTNLDIEILDPAGAVVASDVLDDNYPIARVTPSAAGNYTIRTHLRVCTVEPCQIGVRALTEPTSGATAP